MMVRSMTSGERKRSTTSEAICVQPDQHRYRFEVNLGQAVNRPSGGLLGLSGCCDVNSSVNWKLKLESRNFILLYEQSSNQRDPGLATNILHTLFSQESRFIETPH